MFCAVSNAIEQCNTESLIDVFQATKAVRIHKPGAVSSLVSVRQTATDNRLMHSVCCSLAWDRLMDRNC